MSEQQAISDIEPTGSEDLEPVGEAEAGLSVEERAEAVGWRPDGDLDAEAFLAKRDNDLGLARSNISRLEDTIAQVRKEQSEMARMMRAAQEQAKKSGYEQALKDLRAQQSEAVRDADGDKFAQLREEEDRLLQEKEREEREAVQSQTTQARNDELLAAANKARADYPEIFDTYGRANEWAAEVKYQVDMLGKPVNEAVTKAVSVVAEKYNLKSPQPSGSERGKAAGGNVGFDALPREAKNAFKKFKEQMPDFTKEEYLKLYHEQEA